MTRPADDLRPLSDTLGLVALELVDLVVLSERLERLVASLFARQGAGAADLLTDAQDADLLAQRLAGAAAFVLNLSHAVPTEVGVDVHAAARQLGLSSQARRLRGEAAAGPPDAADEDLLLFAD